MKSTSKRPKKRSVIGIVEHPETGAVLLIKRRDVPIWALPGGGIEPSETPEEAVVREIQEETGLTVTHTRLVAFYSAINRLATDTYVFECCPLSGQLEIGSETLELDYFLLEWLPSPVFFLHQKWILEAKKKLPYPIESP